MADACILDVVSSIAGLELQLLVDRTECCLVDKASAVRRRTDRPLVWLCRSLAPSVASVYTVSSVTSSGRRRRSGLTL